MRSLARWLPVASIACLLALPSAAGAAGSGTADEFEAGVGRVVSALSGDEVSPAAVHRAKATVIEGALAGDVRGMPAAAVIGGLDCVSREVQMSRAAKGKTAARAKLRVAERCRAAVAKVASGGLAGDLVAIKSALRSISERAAAGRVYGAKATALRKLQSSIVGRRFAGETLHGVGFRDVYDDVECVDVKVEAGRRSGALSCAKRLLRRAKALAPAKEPITFGSDLKGTAVTLPATFAPEDTEFWTSALTVPADGTITTFRLKTGDSPVDLPLRFSVVRPSAGRTVTVVTTTNPVYPLKAGDAGVHTYSTSGLSFACCKVRKGDIVTVDNSGTTTPRAYVWFAQAPGATTFSHTSGGDSQNAGQVWTPIEHPGYETLVQAVLQPD